jgi:hypothetical protein
MSDSAIAAVNTVGGLAGVSGLLVGLFWMLATGRLATGRELREKDKRITTLEKLVETRDAQLSMVLKETLPKTNVLMSALYKAAEIEGV